MELLLKTVKTHATSRKASTANQLTTPPTKNGVIYPSSHSRTLESENHITATLSILRETIQTRPILSSKILEIEFYQ
jgi:hypothetical protein